MCLMLCLRQISEEIKYGKVPKLCRFCDTEFEQANTISVMTPVRYSAVCSHNLIIDIRFGIITFDRPKLVKTFQFGFPLNSVLFI